ncbi:MAG: four helix bundle protein [Candidatus Omnitrophota bacterium]|jgi:four helix bundle protein
MQSYRDLEIYKISHQTALDIHKMSLDLPRFELYEEGSQIRRSSKAVSANIVEGFGRKRYRPDYIKFLFYAHSSCDETQEHLKYLLETKSLKDKELFENLSGQLDKLSKKINRFIQAVESQL